MGFQLPSFNLVADIYKGDPGLDFALRVYRLSSPCNLRGYGKLDRYNFTQMNAGSGAFPVYTALLLPALTDIRDISCSSDGTDWVEVPQGSGRWYSVSTVDDVAKGFPNEYRVASLSKAYQGPLLPTFPLWPSPIP